jgi:hypothetical protein
MVILLVLAPLTNPQTSTKTPTGQTCWTLHHFALASPVVLRYKPVAPLGTNFQNVAVAVLPLSVVVRLMPAGVAPNSRL